MTDIIVSGSAQVAAATDHATLNFGAEETAATAAGALELVAGRAIAVQDALDAAGIDRADRGAQHSHVNRHTRWDGNKETVLGWRASLSIECVVRDPATAFTVLEAVAALPNVSANGPHWQVAASNPAHRQARQLAVESARLKAKDYADALGVELGPVTQLDEGQRGGEGGPRMMRASSSMESVEAATQHVSASVTLTFSCEQGVQ